MAERIEMPFGMWTRMGQEIMYNLLDRGAHWQKNWRIRLNRLCAAAMQPYVKLL